MTQLFASRGRRHSTISLNPRPAYNRLEYSPIKQQQRVRRQSKMSSIRLRYSSSSSRSHISTRRRKLKKERERLKKMMMKRRIEVHLDSVMLLDKSLHRCRLHSSPQQLLLYHSKTLLGNIGELVDFLAKRVSHNSLALQSQQQCSQCSTIL